MLSNYIDAFSVVEDRTVDIAALFSKSKDSSLLQTRRGACFQQTQRDNDLLRLSELLS